jgi:hypothetical protein
VTEATNRLSYGTLDSSVEWKLTEERRIGKNVHGSSCGLIDVQSRDLLGRNHEENKILSLGNWYPGRDTK